VSRQLLSTDQVPSVVYMLHNTLTKVPFLNSSNKLAFTLRQLAKVWSILDIQLTESKRMVVTELNPVSAETGVVDSRLPLYDEPCRNSMLATLHTGTRTIIAFGMYTGDRWRNDAHDLLQGVTGVFKPHSKVCNVRRASSTDIRS
jgi:hypothetical protein